jgi:ABC-2 type transport system ATP-binding protein
MQPLLHIHQLSLAFTNKKILNQLDLTVLPGEVISILGSNGAGKSTLLKSILGLHDSAASIAGSINIVGVDLHTEPLKALQTLAYVPEHSAVYPHLSAIENIRYFVSISGKSAGTAITDALHQAGLAESAWHQACQTYSKGMKQKVMLALAIAKQAKLLLLDEPNSGLDPNATTELNQFIIQCKQAQMGVLVVTHDVLSALEFSDRLYMLQQGTLKEIQLNSSQMTLQTLQTLYQGQAQ